MDIFVGNVPDGASDESLTKFLRKELKTFKIEAFTCHKLKGKGCAFLTILDAPNARQFLAAFEQTNTIFGKVSTRKLLNFMGRSLKVSPARNKSDPAVLSTLRKEIEDRARLKRKNLPNTAPAAPQLRHTYGYGDLRCGTWIYQDRDLLFQSLVKEPNNGNLIIGGKSLALVTMPSKVSPVPYRIDIPFRCILSIALGDINRATLTFTLSEAPRCYVLHQEGPALPFSVQDLFGAMSLEQKAEPAKSRVSGWGRDHEQVVGSCLVYRIMLADPESIHAVRTLLQNGPEMPPSIKWPTRITHGDSWKTNMVRLAVEIGNLPPIIGFSLRFQLQRLAQNGYLPPSQVLGLFPAVVKVLGRSGERVACEAVRRITRQLPFAGPEIDGNVFEVENLEKLLETAERAVKQELKYDDKNLNNHPHISQIHRVLVTPTATYLEGPQPETINRVLRQHPKHTNDFLRVTFADEDGERLSFSRNISLKKILHERFKGLLDGVINIAGRPFRFLGFSHSSLRSQSCWYMADFEERGVMLNARAVIKQLGDFSSFRSPAKCAARIGQAFTDTTGAIKINTGAFELIPDVERGARVFSDGVGTISLAILKRLWDGHPQSGKLRPRLYQIRFKGAKGMIALDSRLTGEVLRLRPSMIKFEGSDALDIEVCGSGAKSRPMILNRQYIKIMEDLGVDTDHIMVLQDKAVDNLRQVTKSALKAAKFLEKEQVGRAANVAVLIRKLHQAGFNFLQDNFLSGTVELASLTRLRDIKHRSRIPVEAGVTLMGIMDETNTLKEGEIYCCTDKFVVDGKVAITRAPALHPGDIQVATAVDVPHVSPLNALHNCVVFSQRGFRDLPSQLSGGDLDGDLYSVIWEPRLIPARTVEAADYPRVPAKDIGREVTAQDMTDFFIDFMENDQLGRIATLHQQLADQADRGTEDERCIRLAGMHSTAVDFSKTSIPVNMQDAPKNNFCRPDFMAPSPRVQIARNICEIGEEAVLNGIEENNDAVAALDPENKDYRYYESKNILGKLYRAIDEKEFYAELQARSRELNQAKSSESSLIQRAWEYVQMHTLLVQWEHLRDWAVEVKEAYESQLVDTIYQFSTHPAHPIQEIEVFVGTLLGKGGATPSRHTRDVLQDMKEKFERDVEFTVSCIRKGSDGEDEEQAEALERSIACFAVAIEAPSISTLRNIKKLESFRYIAASVCFSKMEKMHMPVFGR